VVIWFLGKQNTKGKNIDLGLKRMEVFNFTDHNQRQAGGPLEYIGIIRGDSRITEPSLQLMTKTIRVD